MVAKLSSPRSISNHDMVEEDQQAWGRNVQGQFRASYTEHDAAIDRAIAETYGGGGGGGGSAPLRDADGNRQSARRSAQTRATKSSSGNSTSGKQREKPRGTSVTRGVASRGKSDSKLPPTEKEKWIHRDKLALIEVQEYRDLGLEPPQELLRRLAESRADTRQDDSEALRKIESPEPDQGFEDAQEDFEGQSHTYTQHEDYDQGDAPMDAEALAESAADERHDLQENTGQAQSGGEQSPPYQASGLLRKSHSRLPVSSSSPAPVQQDATERESERKRGPSNAGENESIDYPRVRARKSSVGSQAILDDEPGTPSRSAFPTSPSKASFSSANRPKEKGKGKFNTISTMPKTRSTSTGRPGTAGEGRPRTATNPPEGDPPWLAGMYKPDPRLPPDQQMLPTHAKRLAQEQWERDGKNANTYDRDFNPLTNFDDQSETLAADKARPSFARGESGRGSGRESSYDAHEADAQESPVRETPNAGLGIVGHPDGEWPLTASRTPSPTKKPFNGGGYSTIPRLTDSPKPTVGLFPSPRPGDQPAEATRPVTRHGPGAQTNGQLGLETKVAGGSEDPEKDTREKKRGGCACCVLM